MNDTDMYSVDVNTECLHQDLDDIDLYAEHIYDNNEEECDIDFEY